MRSADGSPSSADFARAFVCTQYLLGARGAKLGTGLPVLTADQKVLVKQLSHADQEQRAKALAPELARLIAALEKRRLR
jgi:hypothetical protein